MAFIPIQHDKLRKGLYIRLNGSWFSHPFPTNTFKICTTKELTTIQKLKKVEILFDPEKSDPERGGEEELQEETSQESPEEAVVAESAAEAGGEENVVPEGPPAKLPLAYSPLENWLVERSR